MRIASSLVLSHDPFRFSHSRQLGRFGGSRLTGIAFLIAAAASVVSGCSGGGLGMDPGTGGGGDNSSGGNSAGSGGTGGAGASGATGGAGASGTGGRAAGTGGRAVVGTGGRAAATGGRAGTGGAAGTGLPAGGGGSTPVANLCNWPTAAADQLVTQTIAVSGTMDGGMKRFIGSGPLGTGGQLENQNPIFDLANGATLMNVILGNPAADGVHCAGSCTLINVWWEDVGEDAATLKGVLPTQIMTIDGGGANHAADKVFQHNGPGTMIIKNFCAQDFGKLYRSCGNCATQYARHVDIENVMIIPRSGSALAGVNTNYSDTAIFKDINIKAATNSVTICQRYTGNNTGAEPPKNGSGADGTVCTYAPSDITWQ